MSSSQTAPSPNPSTSPSAPTTRAASSMRRGRWWPATAAGRVADRLVLRPRRLRRQRCRERRAAGSRRRRPARVHPPRRAPLRVGAVSTQPSTSAPFSRHASAWSRGTMAAMSGRSPARRWASRRMWRIGQMQRMRRTRREEWMEESEAAMESRNPSPTRRPHGDAGVERLPLPYVVQQRSIHMHQRSRQGMGSSCCPPPHPALPHCRVGGQ